MKNYKKSYKGIMRAINKNYNCRAFLTTENESVFKIFYGDKPTNNICYDTAKDAWKQEYLNQAGGKP